MRGLLVAAAFVGAVPATTAHADPPKLVCQRAALTVTSLIGAGDRVQQLLGRRCEQDHWSRDAQACFTSAASSTDAQHCLDKLGKDQRTQLEGDADRLGDIRLSRWLARRLMVAAVRAARRDLP